MADKIRPAREEATGTTRDEELAKAGMAWFGNAKRTYDEYQQESLESIKRNRSYVDKLLSDAQSADGQTRNIANQALQNAVETANMVGKQAVRHGDLSIDRQWNLEASQGAAENVVLGGPTVEAIRSIIVSELAKSRK